MAANSVTNKQSAALRTAEKQYMWTKYFHDGNGRCTYIVQAPRGSADGGKALVTKYTYVGITNTIDVTVEYEGAWDESWNVVEDTPA